MSNETDTTIHKDNEPKDVDSYLSTPVHEQTFRFLLIAVPKRIIGLISKAIGIKMAMFAAATYIFVTLPEALPWYGWLVIYIITLFGWDGLKYIDKLKK